MMVEECWSEGGDREKVCDMTDGRVTFSPPPFLEREKEILSVFFTFSMNHTERAHNSNLRRTPQHYLIGYQSKWIHCKKKAILTHLWLP